MPESVGAINFVPLHEIAVSPCPGSTGDIHLVYGFYADYDTCLGLARWIGSGMSIYVLETFTNPS